MLFGLCSGSTELGAHHQFGIVSWRKLVCHALRNGQRQARCATCRKDASVAMRPAANSGRNDRSSVAGECSEPFIVEISADCAWPI